MKTFVFYVFFILGIGAMVVHAGMVALPLCLWALLYAGIIIELQRHYQCFRILECWFLFGLPVAWVCTIAIGRA